MEHFEKLLDMNRCAVERFVKFRICSAADADDVLQEIYLTAYQKFGQLKKVSSFKPWIISIARNKCNDYFRGKAACLEIPFDAVIVRELSDSRHGVAEVDIYQPVSDILNLLNDKDRQILNLYYWGELSQPEIAKALNLPLGTVKSRLHTAKRNFKNKYPYHPEKLKGEDDMKKLPEFLPEYIIEKSNDVPFEVKWEELMGWFIVPRLGEKLSWGIYDIPSRKCSRIYDMQVTGKAMVHDIAGVELTARETDCSGKESVNEKTFVAQLTDTHCRYLAVLRNDGDVKKYITFLDEDVFMPNWGYGQDNCGNETNLFIKGDIQREGKTVTSSGKNYLLDIVGRYTVTMNGRSFDCICVMDIESYNPGVISEQYLDTNGKTILWRRFNRNDWAIDRYKKKWSELLPENEQLTVNGNTYVHWYDCITDYIL